MLEELSGKVKRLLGTPFLTRLADSLRKRSFEGDFLFVLFGHEMILFQPVVTHSQSSATLRISMESGT